MKVLTAIHWINQAEVKAHDFDTYPVSAKYRYGDPVKIEVPDDAHPPVGTAWFIKGLDGRCTLLEVNHDSSD